MDCGLTLTSHLFVKIKCYWIIAMPVHLHIVYGCFAASRIELSSHDRELEHTKSKIFTILSFIEKFVKHCL